MAILDLAGILTRLCADLSSKFSKVSIQRFLTDGTHIANVTVDGVQYPILAPTQPKPAMLKPRMDSTTAKFGSSTYYAREDHIHPTDTSRQEKLVSGTNIKTINGESLLGSGDLTIGGGGGDSKIVWYTDNNCTNAFIDQACTETVAEHYGYDYNSIFYDVILPATSVQLYRYGRYGEGDLLNLVSVKFDTVDETFDLNFFLPGYNWDASKWKTVSLR